MLSIPAMQSKILGIKYIKRYFEHLTLNGLVLIGVYVISADIFWRLEW